MSTATEALAAFFSAFRPGSVPVAVIDRVKLHLLDTFGVALAASGMSFGREAVAAAAGLGGEGRCTVIGWRGRMPAAWAAMANGILAHGLDYDDTHQESVVHVSAGIVPAALAAAEDSDADGATMLAALIAGMETSIRVGLAARGAFHDRGFHPTGICNTFGAAVSAGRVARLPEPVLVHALGIAGSQAAGLFEFLADGADVKRTHPGWAAHGGLVAARLARHGFTGPREVLEGRFGLYRSHLGDAGWDRTAVTADLGERWECGRIGLKPYPSCHFTHAFVDAAARLRAASGFDPAAIEAVECAIAEREVPIICEPAASKAAPQTEYDAKFSLPYAVASMLVRGHVEIDDFAEEALRAVDVARLAARVTYEIDPDADYPRHFGGGVRIRLKDGRVLEEREVVNRGSAERPLSSDEVRAKFRRNAARALAPDAVERIVGAVDGLDRAPSLAELGAALRGDDAVPARAAG